MRSKREVCKICFFVLKFESHFITIERNALLEISHGQGVSINVVDRGPS